MDNYMFVLDLHAGDRTVNTARTAFTVNKTLPECCFQNPSYERLHHSPRLLIL